MVKGIHWVVLTSISQLAHQFTSMVLILICFVTGDENIADRSILFHVERHVVGTIAKKLLVGVLIGSDVSKLH